MTDVAGDHSVLEQGVLERQALWLLAAARCVTPQDIHQLCALGSNDVSAAIMRWLEVWRQRVERVGGVWALKDSAEARGSVQWALPMVLALTSRTASLSSRLSSAAGRAPEGRRRPRPGKCRRRCPNARPRVRRFPCCLSLISTATPRLTSPARCARACFPRRHRPRGFRGDCPCTGADAHRRPRRPFCGAARRGAVRRGSPGSGGLSRAPSSHRVGARSCPAVRRRRHVEFLIPCRHFGFKRLLARGVSPLQIKVAVFGRAARDQASFDSFVVKSAMLTTSAATRDSLLAPPFDASKRLALCGALEDHLAHSDVTVQSMEAMLPAAVDGAGASSTELMDVLRTLSDAARRGASGGGGGAAPAMQQQSIHVRVDGTAAVPPSRRTSRRKTSSRRSRSVRTSRTSSARPLCCAPSATWRRRKLFGGVARLGHRDCR